jgi:hypothetical protein
MFENIRRLLLNLPGWHTKRKIVVFDSDDWGSVALPSEQVFNNLLNAGFNIARNPYLKYDSLASESDLTALFDVLLKFRDKNGNYPVITANTVVANPDFEKIRASGFQEYHYELFTETLKRYPEHANSFKLWNEGIQNKIFHPQFHAREHLNVAYWMKELQSGHPKIHLGFNNNFYILDNATHPSIRHSCTSAFYPKSTNELHEIENIIKDGLSIFKNIFGYTSESFTGTGYIWNSSLEKMLADEGVIFLKGLVVQREPIIGTDRFKKRYHFTGQTNKEKQVHLVRNAFFEPGIVENYDWISDCLNRIDLAFRTGKPAILTTHRINFIGFIDEKYRNKNLKLFENLLTMITQKYKDVEFMSSSSLGNLILKGELS